MLDARGVGGDRRIRVVERVVVTGAGAVVRAGGALGDGPVGELVGLLVAGPVRAPPLLAGYRLDGARALVGGDALGGLTAVGAFVHGVVPRSVVGDEPIGPGWCGPPP